MSEFCPKLEDLVLFRSMSVDEYTKLPLDLPGYKRISDTDRVSLAALRAALRILRRLGAVNLGWLERHHMEVEPKEARIGVDEKIRELLVQLQGETGVTEDLVQTLERIIRERGHVKANRTR